MVSLPSLAERPPCAAAWDGTRAGWAAVAVAVALGCALRIAAARGILGLDELWSLQLAAALPGPGDAFWGLPHDNNHPLNTALMVLLGPDRPALAYRAMAVLFGGLTVLAVAQALARAGTAAAVTGATLAAVSLPFVDFGSEARGYAGLTLASVLAVGQWRRALDGARHARLGLAAAAAFGALNHLAMAMSVAVLGAATLIHAGARLRRPGPTLAAAVRLFWPTALALLPMGLALAVAIARRGPFKVGDVDPFSPAKLATGLGDMTAFTLGLPASGLSWLTTLLLLGCLAAAAHRGLLRPATAALLAAAFVVLPAALWAARMPNVAYPRYYAISAVALVLGLAEVAGRLWRVGGPARAWTAAAVAAVTAASLLADATAIRRERSGAAATLAVMRAEGGTAYAASYPRMAAMLLGAAGGGAPAADPCAAPPDWFVAVGVYDPVPGAPLSNGPAGCGRSYRARAPFASNPLSGTQWTLYRRGS